MSKTAYDPNKRRERYLRDRELKGRRRGTSRELHARVRKTPTQEQINSSQQKIAQIEAKLSRLRELLRAKIADERKESKGSNKAQQLKDRERSKDYYEKHKNEIKNDRAQEARKSGGGKGSGSSSGGGASSMSADELRSAISRTVTALKEAIQDARRLRGGGG